MARLEYIGLILIIVVIGLLYTSMIISTSTTVEETFENIGENVSTFAGTGERGSKDGPGNSATFYYPCELITDSKNTIYVADMDSNKIRKIDSNGQVSTVAGSGSFGLGDGQGSSATFFNPRGICMDKNGNLFVLDSGSGNIRKIDTSNTVTTLSISSKFTSSVSISVDSAGNLYVPANNKVNKIDNNGTITTIGDSTMLSSLTCITIDSTGNIFTTGGSKIYKIDTSGKTTIVAESSSFNSLFGIVLDSVGNIYVVNRGGNKIEKVDSNGNISTVAGIGSWGSNDGSALSASFNNPFGITIDSTGNLYVSDNGNHKIRKITGVTGKPPGPVKEKPAPAVVETVPPPQKEPEMAPMPTGQKEFAPIIDKEAVNNALAPELEGSEKEYDESQILSMYSMLHPRNGNIQYLDVMSNYSEL
jgi:sugar lactone lactonase YvrE